MHGELTQEQSRFYRDQGYFRILNCFDQEETAEIREFVCGEALKQGDDYDKSNLNRKLYNIHDRDSKLMGRVIGKDALVGALSSILGPNVVLVKNRHNHATINNNQGAPAEGMHRDTLQPSRGLLTAVIYLQESTVNNGATRIIPGSHNLPYVGMPQENGGGTWIDEHEEFAGFEDQAVPVPMNEGGVLLFNSTLFHGVGYNSSGEPRMSLTLGFRSADELDAHPDDKRQVLVTGNHIYRGNDR